MLYEFDGHAPKVAEGVFVAQSADLIGRVHLEARSIVLFHAVLRGDTEHITIGEGSNVQDGVAIHADPSFPTVVGRGVSIGHNATVHGCRIDDDCIIGMGSTILNGAHVGAGCLVAAGTVILEGQVIPPGSLVAGVPGKVRRELSAEETQHIIDNAQHYQQLRTRYLADGIAVTGTD